MTVFATVSGSVALPVGDVWTFAVRAIDAVGDPVLVLPVVTVTLPDGSVVLPAVSDDDRGCYSAVLVTTLTGRYVARVVAAGYGAADFTAYVGAVVTALGMPTITVLKAYLGTTSFTDAELQDALDAEAASQRRVCRVPADYPADLAQALKRRCARNLNMRKVPLAVLRGDAGAGDATYLPARDPEVRRLEAGWRKVVVG